MDKNTALKVVNPVLAFLLVWQPITGFVLSMIHWKFLKNLHVSIGVALIVAASIHVILNWDWVKTNFIKK